MANENQLDKMLDDDFLLDDIEDLPEFVTPPTGAYIMSWPDGISSDTLGEKATPVYKIKCIIDSVEQVLPENLNIVNELGEPEVPPKPTDMFDLVYSRDNKFGAGNFKKIAGMVAKHFGCKTIGEVREKSKGLKVLMVLKRVHNKKADRYNVNFVQGSVL
jgi:hypothetical protein